MPDALNLKPRVALVVQRYGQEINGGAELHARLLAERLSQRCEVTVLTSRALDYTTWDSHYPAGESRVGPCKVLRFDHPVRRRGVGRRVNMPLADKLRFKWRRLLSRWGLPLVAEPTARRLARSEAYLSAAGPHMEGLQAHLREAGPGYDCVIFMTALYHPTAMGVQTPGLRALLVPTLHEEKAMFLPVYHRVFRAPRHILFNTPAEQALALHLYGPDIAPHSVVGVGVPVPAQPAQPLPHMTEAGPYIVYVGRIDKAKGCDELVAHFLAHVSRRPAGSAPLRLVMVGKCFMTPVDHPLVHYAGFVSDAERDAWIAGAEALVMPSRHESLSLVLLEAFAQGVPVLANAHCEVLDEHIRLSGAGSAYRDERSFDQALQWLAGLGPEARAEQKRLARAYVEAHYSWTQVDTKLFALVDEMAQEAQSEHDRAQRPQA